MAKFYFHILEYNVLVADDDGLELRNMAEARLEAAHTARDLVQADFGSGVAVSEGEILIADKRGTVLERMPLRGVLY